MEAMLRSSRDGEKRRDKWLRAARGRSVGLKRIVARYSLRIAGERAKVKKRTSQLSLGPFATRRASTRARSPKLGRVSQLNAERKRGLTWRGHKA